MNPKEAQRINTPANQGPHRDNLRDVGRRYADVVGLDEVLAYIETAGRRNTNEAP